METKVCPQCGKNAIKQFEDIVLASSPPQYPWEWWCGCGWHERGGIVRGTHPVDIRRQRWEEANR